jgi:hypothetical protein
VLLEAEAVGATSAESIVTVAALDWAEVAPKLSLTVTVIE